MIDDFRPQALPPSTRRLAEGVPPAPPGTIFALTDNGGYAVPPVRFALHFGRGIADVHVPVGVNDPFVSRLHGMFTCDGTRWAVRNIGRLPIQIPGEPMLLSGHESPVRPGYTPMLIGAPRRPSHLLEVHMVGWGAAGAPAGTETETTPPEAHDLSGEERLVLVALAQRYLRGEPHPQPLSWKQVAADLNALGTVRAGRAWTPKVAEHAVAAVRDRLARGRVPVPGITREEVGEPVGNMLNHNLIQALLRTATIAPDDLALVEPAD